MVGIAWEQVFRKDQSLVFVSIGVLLLWFKVWGLGFRDFLFELKQAANKGIPSKQG